MSGAYDNRAGGGGGGGFRFRVPRDVFAGANRNAAIAARTAGLDANDIAEFDADPALLITLSVGASDTYQARRAGQWRDIGNVAPGPPGPGASDAQVRAQVQAGVKTYARIGGPVVPEAEIDDVIMRDAELTASRILTLLGLTAQEVADFFTGATITGRTITVTQADGSTIKLVIPGDGGGMADGVVSSGVFSADGQTLTLTLDDGTTVDISVPAILRAQPRPVLSLQTFIATNAGAAVGDPVSWPSLTGHWDVRWLTTAGAPKTGFRLPEGRALVAIYSSGGNEITTAFTVDDMDARRYVKNNATRRPTSSRVLITTRSTA